MVNMSHDFILSIRLLCTAKIWHIGREPSEEEEERCHANVMAKYLYIYIYIAIEENDDFFCPAETEKLP